MTVSINDLGSLISQISYEKHYSFTTPGGKAHWVIFMWPTGSHTYLVDFNLTDNRADNIDLGGVGRNNLVAQWLMGDGLLYCGSNDNVANGKGNFYSYNPATRAVTQIGEMNCKNGQSIHGNGSVVAIGTALGGYLYTYNTGTGVLTSHGVPDGPAVGYRYVYFVKTDGTYVYCVIRDGNSWYALSVKISDSTVTTFWKASSLTEIDSILFGVDGYCYVDVKPAQGGYNWFKMDGVNTPVGVSSPPTEETRWENSADTYTFSLALIDPDKDGNLSLRWQNPGNSTWHQLDTVTVVPESIITKMMVGKNELIGKAGDYGKLIRISTVDAVTEVGRCTGSNSVHNPYTFIWDSFTQRYFILGYTDEFHIWNPASSWDLNLDMPYLSATNPVFINTLDYSQARYFRKGFMAGKVLWFIGDYEGSGETGVAIQWYNPADGSNGFLRTALWEGLAQHNPASFVPVGNFYGALSSRKTGGAAVFLLDITNKKVIRVHYPVPGADHAGYIVPLGVATKNAALAGRVMGLIPGSPNTVYRLNMFSGLVEWSVTHDKVAFGSSFNTANYWHLYVLVEGPDGYIYIWYDTEIWKINPVNGDRTQVTGTGGVASAAPAGALVWFGNSLYLYNNSDGSANVRKITGLV